MTNMAIYQNLETCSFCLPIVDCPMEGSEATLVNCVDVRPEVDEAGDGGEGAGLLLVEGLDSQMDRSHALSVSQILERPSTKQEDDRLALEPAQRGMLKERKNATILPSSLQTV